jgi:hypothetical protein
MPPHPFRKEGGIDPSLLQREAGRDLRGKEAAAGDPFSFKIEPRIG